MRLFRIHAGDHKNIPNNAILAIRMQSTVVAALTAIATAVPISIIKLILLSDQFIFFHLESGWFNNTFSLSSFGVMYTPATGETFTHLAYAFFIILMGALSGLFAAEIYIRSSIRRPIAKVSPMVILWGISAGVLSNLLFVFIVLFNESL